MDTKLYRYSIILLCSLGFIACEQESSPSIEAPQERAETATHHNAQTQQISNAMFKAGADALDESVRNFIALKSAIEKFIAAPNQDKLIAAQQIWLEAVLSYRHFFYFRHIGLVAPDKLPQLNQLDYQLASFPIQPGFLDTFGDYPYSGLVHDISFPLSKQSLSNQHGLTDLSEVVLGLYALEFMLFDSGRERNYEDFLQVDTLDKEHKERGFEQLQEIPNNRRRQLLSLQAEILIDDAKLLLSLWQSPAQETTYKRWNDLSASDKHTIAASALESALTQVLLEIGSLNQHEDQETVISPHILGGVSTTDKLNAQRNFITYSLESMLNAIKFLPDGIANQISLNLTNAIEVSTKPEFSNNPKEYWQEVFAKVKQSVDLIPQS